MKPSQYQINLFKKLSPILGTQPKVELYGDETGKFSVRILSCPDPTDENVIFYSTLGLSELALENNSTEILFASYVTFEKVSNILSAAAFFILKDGWQTQQGGVFETLIEMYYPDLDMKHIYFASPFLWEDKLENFSIENINIHFLLTIPISDKELDYLTQHGKEALEDLFQEKNIRLPAKPTPC